MPPERPIMKTTAWDAVAELDRMGFASLRKARKQTQVELADKLGIDQAGVSAIENRSDLLLSTLAKYVRALGGNVEIRAVFPEATFNLEPLIAGEVQMRTPEATGKRGVVADKPAPQRRRAAVAVGD